MLSIAPNLVRDRQHRTADFRVSETRIDRFGGTAERQEVRPMTWIRLESERYPPPAPTADDQPIIDAEYRVIHELQDPRHGARTAAVRSPGRPRERT